MKLCAIGTGAITKSMLAEFQRSDVLHVTSIYSRKEETGKAMAAEFRVTDDATKYFTERNETLGRKITDGRLRRSLSRSLEAFP